MGVLDGLNVGVGGLSLGSLVLIWGPDTCQRVLLGMRARIARR